MKRRQFIAGLGGVAARPLMARAQQPATPVVGFVSGGSAQASAGYVAAFRKGLRETGHVEGQNVMVDYHWLEGQFDRATALMADLVRRRVAVIAATGSVPGSKQPRKGPFQCILGRDRLPHIAASGDNPCNGANSSRGSEALRRGR
jgi:hypothetical protein